ncbi:MAG: glycine-rich protein, partial [Candidatus Cybelea sp.]
MTISGSDRYMLGMCAAIAILVGCGGHTDGSAIPSINGNANVLLHHRPFYYTGKKQSFKVPVGVRSISIVARGAGGAPLSYYSSERKKYGRGGRIHAVIPVRPGEMLYVFVGGEGSPGFDYRGGSGFNGGGAGGLYNGCGGRSRICYGYGGGGASDIRENGDSLSDRIVVVGGGGGAGTCGVIGGGGGGKIGGDGGSGTDCEGTYFYGGGGGGNGGTQSHG